MQKSSFNEFVLEPETVAEVIVKQVLSGYGAQLILTGRYTPIALLRGAPSWLQEGIRNSVQDVLRV
jgi:all-trans-retinol dehydrogenase (NAD+)